MHFCLLVFQTKRLPVVRSMNLGDLSISYPSSLVFVHFQKDFQRSHVLNDRRVLGAAEVHMLSFTNVLMNVCRTDNMMQFRLPQL